MKLITNSTKRVSLAALLATLVVGMAISAQSQANERGLHSNVIEQQSIQLSQQIMQNEQQLELSSEQQLNQQIAKAEGQYVAQICQQYNLSYDNDTSTCLKQ
ncbi:hypothetical protein [Shewanella sp. OMA3-2]|uniref:hypothetical protein n=1 Tax=Shewanella sp. OMA3-2 TaxID=2908650 RepID=UPI001F3492CE|nr:hypothetical protein [Shewanella sp. OMA3-2]UJF22693.1 hypothetical protein L0B17_04655 [Shewanella sp. OMA3-2]